ncbi:MAG: cytochrome c5 family protein [Betaproteobacteria bacterium]|nr:cytochrome c5 family protein [Betaproteobacteria bacterium]
MDRFACLSALALFVAGSADTLAQDARLALGAKVFDTDCKTCHDTGKAKNDAPQLSETSEWKDRLGKGRAELYKNSIEGFSGYFAMPPRGGNPNLTDEEVKAAVDFLLYRAGLWQ